MPQQDSERKINLLFVVAGLGIGGAEVVIQELVRAIDGRRFNVAVCCIKVIGIIGEQLAKEGFDVVVLSDQSSRKVDYLTFLKLRQVIREREIEVVHTHTTDGLADAAVCKILHPRLKLVHTFHFGNYPHQKRRLMWMERLFSRVATRLIAVGEVQRKQLRSVYGFSERRIERVWNGVVAKPRSDGSAFRKRIGAERHIVIGTIATLIEQKGLHDFLAAAREFQGESDRIRFVIVGEGRLRSELEAARSELGLDRMVVLSGWVPNAAEVALPAFDIFLQSSLWEAMSIAILEAMAAEKAIVATAVGENPYILDHDVDGLLVEPRSPQSIAAALRRLIGDAELRARLGAAAAEKIAQRFTVEHMTRKYEDIYAQILRRDP